MRKSWYKCVVPDQATLTNLTIRIKNTYNTARHFDYGKWSGWWSSNLLDVAWNNCLIRKVVIKKLVLFLPGKSRTALPPRIKLHIQVWRNLVFPSATNCLELGLTSKSQRYHVHHARLPGNMSKLNFIWLWVWETAGRLREVEGSNYYGPDHGKMRGSNNYKLRDGVRWCGSNNYKLRELGRYTVQWWGNE